MPSAPAPLLTRARRSLWKAVREWPELQTGQGHSIFIVQFDHEQEQPLLEEAEPSISDFPAIEILPDIGITPSWDTNVAQTWGYSLQIRTWQEGWNLPEAEAMIERLTRAIFQCSPPGSSVPYTKSTLGYYPRLGALSLTTTHLADEENDGPKVTVTALQVLLRTEFKPFQPPAG